MQDRDGTADALAAKRAEIAAALARGPGGPETAEARAADLIAGRGAAPADPDLRRLVAEYRDLADTRLAAEGEVFAPQDDA